jgi:cellulose synthase/poly-beta-1,6-N-acetylglucosamine synthase-like glycosyltransferase
MNADVQVETERVFLGWDYLVFALLTCLSLAAIVHFFSYLLFLDGWLTYPLTFSVVTLLVAAVLASAQLRWLMLPLMTRPRPMPASSRWKVGVATTFVPAAEPLEMLEETVQALVAMETPHDTWVLDEGDDPRVKAMCQRLGARHFSRKGVPEYQSESGAFQSRTKHGNYNAWLREIGFDRYEIVAAFDPDHVPERAFLTRVLGYFADRKIGYVQAAQAYYNQEASFIARGAAEETYAYYSSMQMASFALGYPILTGCHNTHRVSALRQVGGFAAHDADDLLLTQLYRAAGWQGVYVPEILARGLTPVDWRGYLMQQRRWARSVLDVKLRIYPRLAAKLPTKTRLISFLHGLNYLQEGLLPFAGLILLAVMLATGTTPALSKLFGAELAVLYGALLLCNFYRQRFYLSRREEWGLPWRAGVLQFAKWPYFVAALTEVILDKRVPYTITPKVKQVSRSMAYLWPQVFIALTLCVAWVVGSAAGHEMHVSVHVWTVVMVAGALVLVCTGLIDFPQPYVGRPRPSSALGSAVEPMTPRR